MMMHEEAKQKNAQKGFLPKHFSVCVCVVYRNGNTNKTCCSSAGKQVQNIITHRHTLYGFVTEFISFVSLYFTANTFFCAKDA